jgi:hypothetical protein
MTIPDIGHCVGTGSSPLQESIRRDGNHHSGVCAACSRRLDLHDDGTLPVHHSIGGDDRQGDGRRDDPDQSPAQSDV